MKLATVAAVGVVGTTLMAAPLAPANAFCGPLFPLCVAGAVVAGAATIATLPFAAAAAAGAPYGYYPAPAYYGAPAPAYYPAVPAYYPPAYYGGPVVALGYGPYWRAHYWGRPARRWRHY
jgi:hypothetical protein